ncbi:hypothetical protein HCA69_10030 [Listeria grandensis]|uniref:Inositol monophosphatase n=1 Tax=Listeria grandensis TaxID=1494963 RepID=A0A7X0Y473_9LIST|nr:inositol monophosphatase family protein [Listeria grandensis]MBC1936705.1 hypothetical protein [Listeria grandensis]
MDNNTVEILNILGEVKESLDIEYKKSLFSSKEIYSELGADGEITWGIDKTVEQIILKQLCGMTQSYSVLSEEIGYQKHQKLYMDDDIFFIIDPIDGTYNALMGFPFFSVSICVFINKTPTIGWVYDICRGVLFIGIEGEGAFQIFNEQWHKIKVSGVENLKQSTISMIRPQTDEQLENYRDIILSSRKIRWLSCSSLEIVYIAAGIFDAFVDFASDKSIKICDVAASLLILKEAGGVTLSYNSIMSEVDKESLHKRYKIIAASSDVLLNEIYRRLNKHE